MELFTNPNIASVLVERLPCAFAPTVNGKMGTHYAMVLLDDKDNVLYVGSECEHKHGESVQAIHDMGDKDNTLCYVATSAFKKALNALKVKGVINPDEQIPKDADLLHNYMRVVFNTVWKQSTNKHNNRFTAKMFGNPDKLMRRQIAMQQTVNTITASLLNLRPTEIDRGKLRGDFPTMATRFSPKEVLVYPEILTVKTQYTSIPSDGVVYHLYFNDYPDSIATRIQGQWQVKEDQIKGWARDHYQIKSVKWVGNGDKPCVFCGEKFSRMSKHTQGARHIDRVLEVAKLTCKATSRMGLQVLNNPKTRSVFIKR